MRYLLMIFLLLITSICFATDYTSNQSGDWTTTTVWTPNGTPGSGDTVSIGHAVALVGAVTVSAFSLDAGITFDLDNNTLTVSGGEFAVNGTSGSR